MSLKTKNSFIRRHPRSYSHASTTCSEDSDSEDDERERSKYINLKCGHNFLWSASKYGQHWDLTQGTEDFFDYEDNSNERQPLYHENPFERTHSARRSFKHLRRKASFKLDTINLNNDFEYGFNHKRARGSKADNKVLLRPISFISPQPERRKEVLSKSFSDVGWTRTSSDASQFSSSKTLVSFAQNDFEAQLERDVLFLRSQPSNLKFQGCRGKLDKTSLAADIASARRQRFVRRHLSFSLPTSERWKKTLSLDSGLATDSSFKSLKAKHLRQHGEEVKSEEVIEPKRKSSKSLGNSQRPCKSVEFLDLNTSDTTSDKEHGLKSLISPSDTIIPDSNETLTDSAPKIHAPPSIIEKPLEIDVHLSSSEKDDTSKNIEKVKRRGSFPHILSAFKIPNKTFRRLMKRKPAESTMAVKASHHIDVESPSLPPVEVSIPEAPEANIRNGIIHSQSVDAVTPPRPKSPDLSSRFYIDRSGSAYSLPKVDEDKESYEFDLSFERRSKSSCSISFGQGKQQSRVQHDQSMLHRRMSDTALSWDEKNHNIGCSPGKRFVRKLFAPVVCGVSTPDRYGLLNDSLQSLNSYDSSSVASEPDISYPRLFDFSLHELVEEMTLIDKELLIRIPWEELSNCGWMSPDKFILAPNIMKMVQFFNRIAMLVATNILLEETPYRRSKVIRKAIKLACRCRQLKNYNSLKAVLSGLQCTPIFRLKHSWKQVPSRYRRLFRELSELMSESNNFTNYREELTRMLRYPPCIPFLGNFLTQVAHVHAFLAVQDKYKTANFFPEASERDTCADEDASEQDDNVVHSIPSPTSESSDSHNDPRSSTSSTTSHTRNGSNDSGVVLNLNRLSVASDETAPSPFESGLSSPDDEIRNINDIFPHKSKSMEALIEPQDRSPGKSPMRSISHPEQRPCKSSEKLSRSDTSELRSKQFKDIAHIINSKPVQPIDDANGLYHCALEFWHFLISAVQYNLIPKPYIRRFLMDSPFNTEEDNYKLSLKREPPLQR